MRAGMVVTWIGTVFTVGLVVSGCGGDVPMATPTSTTATLPTSTLPHPEASELSPSQVGASTIAAPPLPPPCDVAELEFSPLQVPTTGAAEVTSRVRNIGTVECEVDVFESAIADPMMEPDVWLSAGAEAELLLSVDADACAQNQPLTSVELIVNEAAVTVAVPTVEQGAAVCGLTLVAIYTVDDS